MIQIKLVGSGGQGIIMTGEILACAAVMDGKEGSAISAYGSAARGGIVTSEVIIDDKFIPAPFVEKPDYLIAMSQLAYDNISKIYLAQVNAALPVFFINSTTVKPALSLTNQILLPATELAVQELKSEVGANLVMLGFFASYTNLIQKVAYQKALKQQITEKYLAINLRAFELGYEQGMKKNPSFT